MTLESLSHRYLWQPDAVDQLLADEQLLPSTAGRGAGGNGRQGRDKGHDLTASGTVVWALGDNLGTVRDLAVYDQTTGVTTMANHRVYDSYGNLKSQTNAAVDCLFGFTGRPFDNTTGLQNNLNCWYDPIVAGWMSQDPIGFLSGTTNLYCYCGNSPTNATDPTGLEGANPMAAEFAEAILRREAPPVKRNADIDFKGVQTCFYVVLHGERCHSIRLY